MCTLQFGQINFAIERDTFCNSDKYIFQFYKYLFHSQFIAQLGVELDLAILQEFLIPGVLWGYLECLHFPEITNSRSS